MRQQRTVRRDFDFKDGKKSRSLAKKARTICSIFKFYCMKFDASCFEYFLTKMKIEDDQIRMKF